MHPGGKITSNYARVEKKARANSGPPGSRESPLKKKTMERWKESPTPPKSGESHMRRKKGETEGKIPAPRGAENPTRRTNFVSRTPISSTCVPSRQHTQQDDARFQPHARTHQRKKGRLRPQKRWRLHPKTKSAPTSAELCAWFFFLPAFVRRKEPNGLAGTRDNERQVTTILSVSPRKPERVLFDART